MANLVRTVGRKAASALVALGEPIGASRAAALGLVNRVVPLPDPMRGAIALAERLAAMRRPASAETKRLLHDAADLPRAKALALSFFGWDDSQIGAPRALGEFAEDALRTAGAI
ncbi:MAG: enoyl-CoA hydratase-related protein [Burkholderiales bacterium]|nr:enoyl-CoA hydratase-related protein [Burkholderiales bacterium]